MRASRGFCDQTELTAIQGQHTTPRLGKLWGTAVLALWQIRAPWSDGITDGMINIMQARPQVIVPVTNREEFLARYFEKGDLGGLFVPGSIDVGLGEEVDLEISFLEEHVRFRIRGTVKWRRPVSTAKVLPPGLGIEFLSEDDAARELLLAYATGRDVALVERDGRRFGCHIKIKRKGDAGTVAEQTDDISEGGAFILTEQDVSVGTRFKLKLQPPGALFGINVDAVVAWKRETGRKGIGVEFIFDSPRKREQVSRLVANLKEKILQEIHAGRGDVN